MHARSPAFLVVTWFWSLILCRAKPQLLIKAPGTFRTCNILVPHASGGCLVDLSVPNSTVPKSCPQCPCEVSVTLFSGQNLTCLVFCLGLRNCVLFCLLWVTVSLEKREGRCSHLVLPGVPYARLLSLPFTYSSTSLWFDSRKRTRTLLVLKAVGKG